MATVMHGWSSKGAPDVDIDHKGPETCTECGQDAYIRLVGTDDYVCAHCFDDRGRAANNAREAKPSQSPPTRSAGDAAR